MTSQGEVLRKVLSALAESGAEYMIVGSFAASVHGFTRATHDIDIVLSIPPESVSDLARALGGDFFMDEESARGAVARKEMFNVIHLDTGVKVDFWPLEDDDFRRTQFARRITLPFDGVDTFVASAEDTVLSKLLRHRETPSDRHISDVRGILAAGGDDLDWSYLNTWSERLGLSDLLREMRESL